MRVGIICAGDKELAPFLTLTEWCKQSEKAMLRFYEGRIFGIDVIALFSGVCKVNAAIAAQILIDSYGAEVIINAGTAGGINPELMVFDSVISTEVAYHDVAPDILTEFHPCLDSAYFRADQNLLELTQTAVAKLDIKDKVYWGRMVTGERFITDEGREEIIERFDPLTVDMESGSIAHVCYVNNIPFIAIRSVTDTAAHSGLAHFEENCRRASIIAKDITVALLSEIHDLCSIRKCSADPGGY